VRKPLEMNEAKKARGPTRLTRGNYLRLVGSGLEALALSSCGVPFVGDQGSLPKARTPRSRTAFASMLSRPLLWSSRWVAASCRRAVDYPL
jgi:hypothetical protein